MASGAPVTEELEKDVYGAKVLGQEAKKAFVAQRIANNPSSTISFIIPIKRNKLKTIDACNKTVKLTSSQGKVQRDIIVMF